MRYWLLLLILSVGSLATAQDGKLDSIRQDVRAPRSESPASSSSSSRSSSIGSDDVDVYLFFAKMGFYVVTSPFTIPPLILCDHYDTHATFVAYPYAEHWNGLMQFSMESHKIDDVVPMTWENMMTLRASVEEGNNFSGINRLGVTFLVDTMTRFGIGGGVHFYEERTTTTPDRSTIGDLNLLFRFAQSERAQYHAGVGVRFLNDRQQTDTGINFVYGFDCFPYQPLSFGMQFEFGTLGNAWVYQATGRVGLVWKFSEVYAGYDYLHVGS